MTPQERAAAILREWRNKGTGYTGELEDDIASAIEEAVAEELESMSAAFKRSAASPWPRSSNRARSIAFDDGLSTAAGRLHCRAVVILSQGKEE